jgi:hypothetical protein
MMSRNLFLVTLLLIVSTISSCATQHPTTSARVVISPQKIATDLRVIQSLAPQMERTNQQFVAFHSLGAWRERGYFNAEETDELESLLFGFVTGHTALWDMVNSYGGPEQLLEDIDMASRAELAVMSAVLLLAIHTAELVAKFADDPIAIKEINQDFYRSGISFGTYDRMRENVTDPEILQVIVDLKGQYANEIARSDSACTSLPIDENVCTTLIEQLPALLQEAENQLLKVARVYPSYAQSKRITSKDYNDQHLDRYKVRAVLFKDVSRLKSPTAHLLKFSQAQKQQVYDLLEPGDLVLTYTAGYMSSVFIPGKFKHGIVFIGTAEQRSSLNLTVSQLPDTYDYGLEALSKNLDQLKLPNGNDADMIEAVAEGVIFNNLGYVMDTHINRLLVLRPRLSEPEMQQFLLQAYTYLGEGYDFRFDFADTTYQACTEVIYRALDGKGTIRFELTERVGHVTLSADDIVNDYLEKNTESFDFVLYAENAPETQDHEANILVGSTGTQRLKTLMQ